MAGETVFAVAFLAMSGVSLGVQLRALRQLTDGADTPRDTPAYQGLLRTSLCRVGAASLYVLVGVNVLVLHLAAASVTFAVFCAVQILWQANARADVRLKHKLTPATPTNEGNRRAVPE